MGQLMTDTMKGSKTSAPESVATVVAPVNFGSSVIGDQVIVVANRTGGQGKTLISQLIYAAYPDLRLFCADSVNAVVERSGGKSGGARSSVTGTSKLGRMVRGVKDFGAGPSDEEYRADPKSYSRFWDPFGLAVLYGDPLYVDGKGNPLPPEDFDMAWRSTVGRKDKGCPMLIDLGANVIDSLLTWSKASGGPASFRFDGGGPAFDFVIPVVNSPQSIGDAQSIFDALKTGQHLPVRKVVLVLNEMQGPFPGPLNKSTSLQNQVRDAGGTVLPMRFIDNKGIRFVESENLPVDAVLGFDGPTLGKMMDVGVFEGFRVQEEAANWVKELVASFHEALAPSTAPKIREPRPPVSADAISHALVDSNGVNPV